MTANGQHSLKLDISKELFFENFDDPDIKEKVKKITNIPLCREISKINIPALE